MLVLKAPILEENGGWCLVKSCLCDEGKQKELVYFVKNKFKDGLRVNAEPFLFWAILIAVQEGESLLIEGECGERFLYGIKQLLFPAFIKMGLKNIPNIQANNLVKENKVVAASGVATGLSGGIDSLYVVLENRKEKFKLTHLVQFFPDLCIEEINISNLEMKENSSLRAWNSRLAEELNMPIINVYSNFMQFCKFHFEQVHAFCNLSHAILLKGIISTYLYATGYDINQTKLDFSDTSHYELLIAQAVNSSTFEMISYHPARNRMDKTLAIADNQVAQKFLHVCVKRGIGEGNCSNCFKCKRTMTSLDVIGKLEYFSKVFDLDLYRKNKRKIWGEVLYKKKIMKDPFAKETVTYAKMYRYKKPIGLFFYVIGIGLKNQINKLKRLKKHWR